MSAPAFQPLPNSDEKVNRDHLHQAIPDNSNRTFTNDENTLPVLASFSVLDYTATVSLLDLSLKILVWDFTL
jgi:hypothetical protein